MIPDLREKGQSILHCSCRFSGFHHFPFQRVQHIRINLGQGESSAFRFPPKPVQSFFGGYGLRLLMCLGRQIVPFPIFGQSDGGLASMQFFLLFFSRLTRASSRASFRVCGPFPSRCASLSCISSARAFSSVQPSKAQPGASSIRLPSL